MTNTSEFIYVVTTQSADDERAFINERDAYECIWRTTHDQPTPTN